MLFGVAYLLVRLINLLLYVIAAKRDPDLLRALFRFAPTAMVGPLIILAAGIVGREWREVLWVIALAVVYAGALIGRGRGWRISPLHFVERYGLIVIIARRVRHRARRRSRASPAQPRNRPGGDPRHRRNRGALVGVLRRDSRHRAAAAVGDDRRGARATRARLLQLPAPAHDRRDRPVRARPKGDHRAHRRTAPSGSGRSTLRRSLRLLLDARRPSDPPRISDAPHDGGTTRMDRAGAARGRYRRARSSRLPWSYRRSPPLRSPRACAVD